MFHIYQVRLGLATNSSSTHSLILLPGGAQDQDANGSFGWEFFTAGSRNSKRRYAACQLRQTMKQVASSAVAHTVAEAWSGMSLSEDELEDYIDHQSQWTLPLDWEGKGVDKAFFDDLLAFLMRNDVVILGGNDNTEEAHPLSYKGNGYKIALECEGDSSNLVCRKDDGYWVLFNRANGTKVRMSFGDGKVVSPAKATVPELVDVKITDYCTMGCDFCYQDSTPQGIHADKDFLSQLANALGTMKVFEVAIGGGEPTLHPDFIEILEDFRSRGVVPNFTTKNLAWLHDPTKRARILEAAGAFAYSIGNADDLAKIASIRDTYEISEDQVNCQYVMGTTDLYEFERILTTAAERDMRITLLGYKQDGRGAAFRASDYSGWVEILKKVHEATLHIHGIRIGIDTALAREYQGQLADLGVPRWCYEIEEGKFSMYIDAVAKTTAKSSYGSPLVHQRFTDSKSYSLYANMLKEIPKHFATY